MSTIKVVKPNFLDMKPGGWYNLNEDNWLENRIVKLHLLAHHVELMINDLCETSENRIKKGKETERLADELFKEYKRGIEKGLNMFDVVGSAEEGVDPISYRIGLVVDELKEAKSYCENDIERDYIKSLIQLATYVDIEEYQKLHAKLDSFEKDHDTVLYWKDRTKL